MIQTYLECDHCGDVAIESDDGMFSDGDGGECESCGMPGQVSCDAETDPYWLCDYSQPCTRRDCDECAEARKAIDAAKRAMHEEDEMNRKRDERIAQ